MNFDIASLQQMLANAWPVISVLVLCSLFSGAIILERWFTLRGAFFDRETLMKRLRKYIQEKRREQLLAQVDTIRKPVGRVLSNLLDAILQKRISDRLSADRLASRLIRSETSGLMQYVSGLGTIGSVAPFIGLF